jgi:hypothetical protein
LTELATSTAGTGDEQKIDEAPTNERRSDANGLIISR